MTFSSHHDEQKVKYEKSFAEKTIQKTSQVLTLQETEVLLQEKDASTRRRSQFYTSWVQSLLHKNVLCR